MDLIESTLNKEEDEAERQNFLQVLAAFKNYRKDWMQKVNQRMIYIETLSSSNRLLLSDYSKTTLQSTKHCIDRNFLIIRNMIKNADKIFNNCHESNTLEQNQEIITNLTQNLNTEKVTIVLKQIVRDWTTLGKSERQSCYNPIINSLIEYFSSELDKPDSVKVLVPGAGLGRLVYEISLHGFYSEGNEFSLFMLIASNFLLNRCVTENQYEIFPFIHQFVNNLHEDDTLRGVKFPDQSPSQCQPKGTMNMIAGDFVQVYSAKDQEGEWNAIATCFFIDCANNIVEFIEIIYSLLKPGGIWINLGPLLYHFSDLDNENSIEPSYNQLRKIIKDIGFQFIKEKVNVKTKYSQNTFSMQQLEYKSVFFVCKKK